MNLILQIVILLFLLISNIHAQSDSIQLIHVKEEACNISKDSDLFRTRISDLQYKGDTTIITVAFTEVCGQEWKGQIAIKNDSLNLSYHKGITPEIFCTCCYSITYTLLGYHQDKHTLLFRGKEIHFSEKEYHTKHATIDRLDDGTVKHSHFFDGILQVEIITMKHKRIVKKYKNGVLISEKEILRK